jgi:hypothetical protein
MMGLDIFACSKLEYVRPFDEDRDEDVYDPELISISVYGGLFEVNSDGLESGMYRYDESTHFRAGSYSGYSAFREWLASLSGNRPEALWNEEVSTDGTPFGRLINFSDCEGLIGPKTSSMMRDDFDQYRETAERSVEKGEVDRYFLETYDLFREAFDLASDGGAVVFC